MKSLVKIAWRSLWRNRRRTILTAAAVVLALVLALFMRSMQFGSYDQMIQAGVNQVGYLQVHDTGYWENQSIDRAFFYNKNLGEAIKKIPEIQMAIPKLETFSLASYGKQTKGVLISGINPVLQNKKTHLGRKIVKGSYLSNKQNEVLVGDNLARYLHISIGDSLVLLGQGYRGITSYGIYTVKGIFHLPSTEINSQVVYMNLTAAQNFVYPYQKGLLTGISLYLKDPLKLQEVKKQLSVSLGKHYEIISWKKVLTDILQSIKVDNISGQVMLLILYIIAAFGIFSTTLMMTMEKRKQYAIMISIGMQRSRLVWVSILETIIITITGILAGLIIVTPILFYLHANPIPLTGEMSKVYEQFNIEPILPFAVKAHIFISQTLIIFVLSTLSTLYPIIYLSRFNILKAFRH